VTWPDQDKLKRKKGPEKCVAKGKKATTKQHCSVYPLGPQDERKRGGKKNGRAVSWERKTTDLNQNLTFIKGVKLGGGLKKGSRKKGAKGDCKVKSEVKGRKSPEEGKSGSR